MFTRKELRAYFPKSFEKFTEAFFMMKLFCENVLRFLAVNFFAKNLHGSCLTGLFKMIAPAIRNS